MNGQEKKTDQGLRACDDAQMEAKTEALLARTLVSHPPPESLHRQVRQQVAAAWDRRPLSLRQRFEALLRAPVYRRAWGAVVALALVAVVAALVAPSSATVVGTAIGDAGMVILIIILAGVALLILARFLPRR